MKNIKKSEIISKIIEEAKSQGKLPWQMPWFAVKKQNASGHVYSGINRVLLADSDDQIFLTFNQVKKIGGHVLKGQHGREVIFYDTKIITKENENGEEEVTTKIMILKSYYVFGLSQLWLPENEMEKLLNKKGLNKKNIKYDLLDTVKNICDVEVLLCDQAYYSPAKDKIVMPQSFNEEKGFTSTLLHELIHATGHQSRLNRFGAEKRFERAAEELVAEIGAVLLANELGLEYEHNNSVAYIQGWMKALEENKNDLFKITRAAEEAVEYVVETINKVKAA